VTIILVAVLLWILWSMDFWTEKQRYTVLERRDGYEIREYPSFLAAQVEVTGDFDSALDTGFRILAGYIFGNNTKKQKISMTAPVISQTQEKISMTAPVIAVSSAHQSTIVRFIMPASYTTETLPLPSDKSISIVTVPAQRQAVLRFSGYYQGDKIQKQKDALRELLKRDNVRYRGEIGFAGYNGPGTLPFLMRNEVFAALTSRT